MMKVRTKIWIDDERGHVVFGSGRVHMLETIDRLGSMNKAAKALRMSYRALWGKIKSTEKRMGEKILTTRPGGGKESGSVLTPEAKAYLAKYKRLQKEIIKVADKEFEKIFGPAGNHEA
jgi:molybdate transport system regulatory protein